MIQQQLASAMEQVDETTLSSMASQATLLVSLEYEAQAFPMMYRWSTSSGWAARCWP